MFCFLFLGLMVDGKFPSSCFLVRACALDAHTQTRIRTHLRSKPHKTLSTTGRRRRRRRCRRRQRIASSRASQRDVSRERYWGWLWLAHLGSRETVRQSETLPLAKFELVMRTHSVCPHLGHKKRSVLVQPGKSGKERLTSNDCMAIDN